MGNRYPSAVPSMSPRERAASHHTRTAGSWSRVARAIVRVLAGRFFRDNAWMIPYRRPRCATHTV